MGTHLSKLVPLSSFDTDLVRVLTPSRTVNPLETLEKMPLSSPKPATYRLTRLPHTAFFEVLSKRSSLGTR